MNFMPTVIMTDYELGIEMILPRAKIAANCEIEILDNDSIL